MTGTGTCRAAALALAALSPLIAGCGSAASQRGPGRAATQHGSAGGAFAWLRPGPAPAGWPQIRIASGAVMPYPPGWRLSSGDAGTATAVLSGARHRDLGYLNLTPAQGEETTANWERFRVGHNAQEGDRNVRLVAGAPHLRFRSGIGACVRDIYTTSIGDRFIELACLVRGTHASTVIVGAAPPGAWARLSPDIEHVISSFTT